MLNRGRGAKISVASTDKDVIEKVSRIMGLPHLGPYPNNKGFTPNAKPLYVVNSEGASAAGWMMTVYPFMCGRRRASIRRILSVWRCHKLDQRYITRTWNGWNGRKRSKILATS